MKQFQLTVTIDEDDVPLVYELFAHYHKDRAAACESFRELIDGTEKRKRVASTGTSNSTEGDSDTFYYLVCSQCTCRNCYNSFVRTDRLPWKPLGGGKFEHQCAGVIQVPETCPVYNCRVPGYIYRSSLKTTELKAAEQDLIAKQLANEKARAKIVQEKEVHQMKIERLKRSSGATAGTPSQEQYRTLRDEIENLQKHIYHQVCNYRSTFDKLKQACKSETGQADRVSFEKQLDEIMTNLSSRAPRCVQLYEGNGFQPPSQLEAVVKDVDYAYLHQRLYEGNISNLTEITPFPLVTLIRSSDKIVSKSPQDTHNQEPSNINSQQDTAFGLSEACLSE